MSKDAAVLFLEGMGMMNDLNQRSDEMSDFEKDLTVLLNKHSEESASNTPDFILAQYINSCLAAFTTATQQRESWYGRDSRPSMTEAQKALAIDQ